MVNNHEVHGLKFPNFDYFCSQNRHKQCLQTASASGGLRPQTPWAIKARGACLLGGYSPQ